MRKCLSLCIALILFSLLFTSCVDSHIPLPYGKWECKEYHIILDFNPETDVQEHFKGTYVVDGKEIEIFAVFGYVKDLHIYKESDRANSNKSGYELFSGYYKFNKNKLYYDLNPSWQKKSGIKKTIVFEKIQDYEAPVKTK